MAWVRAGQTDSIAKDGHQASSLGAVGAGIPAIGLRLGPVNAMFCIMYPDERRNLR